MAQQEAYDTDPKNYSVQELIEALGLKGTPSKQEVDQAVEQLDAKYAATNPVLAQFFSEAGRSVVKALRLETTKRPEVTRLINVDSFYRESLLDNPDNFVCTLSEPLLGVTSLCLTSIELPQTWYAFTAAKGTNALVFQTIDADATVFSEEVVLPEGNYSNFTLLVAVEAGLNAAVLNTQHFKTGQIGAGPWFTLAQDPINGLATLALAATFTHTVKLRWYDPSFISLTNTKLNANLGWALGFRSPSSALEPGTSLKTAAVVAAASTTKYLILKLDDYSSNRLSSNVVTVRTIPDQQISLPSYSSNASIARSSTQVATAYAQGPRRLTNAQLQTITNIASAPTAPRVRAEGGDTTNVFAKIPIKHQADWANYAAGANKLKEDGPGKLIVEMGGTLQKNKRVYFGPVTITKLSVALCDDHGNLIGLNNQDWSFTLEATF